MVVLSLWIDKAIRRYYLPTYIHGISAGHMTPSLGLGSVTVVLHEVDTDHSDSMPKVILPWSVVTEAYATSRWCHTINLMILGGGHRIQVVYDSIEVYLGPDRQSKDKSTGG
jgi:hypothetical protein